MAYEHMKISSNRKYDTYRNKLFSRECDEICLSGAYMTTTTGEHDGSFIAPPLPPRTPAPILPPPARNLAAIR